VSKAFEGHEDCGCCGFHATQKFLNEMAVQRLHRTALNWAGLERVIRTESGDVPYVPGEVRLTELLADNADRMASEIEQPIRDALDRPYLDEVAVTDAAQQANQRWQEESYPEGLDNEVREVLSATALIGAHELGFAPALDDIDRLRIVNGMSASAKYYTNRYFNTHVMTALIDAVHVAVLDGTSNDGAQIRAIHALLDRRLRSVPYWNIVANAAASRAYHYGYIKTGLASGLRTIRFSAVIDSRTSEICQAMNGTTWRTADLSAFADQIATATTDDIKDVAPWVKASDIQGLTPAQLLTMGVAIPPLHGRCRSQLIFT